MSECEMDILQISTGLRGGYQMATAWIKPPSPMQAARTTQLDMAELSTVRPPDPGQKAAIGRTLLESRISDASDLPHFLRQIEVTLKPYGISMLPPDPDARPADSRAI
ncbi:hypothetical protein AAD018_005710 [Aestuariibius insulae]|uniref:hypothetical protein n=1 Tax=Aestuariibius insulae TaxID=2058287 RepID=UPI00345E9CA3